MPVPTIETVHIDAAMTAISVAYRRNQYVAEQVFSAVGVAKKSDKYFIHDREHLRDDLDDLRRPGDTSREVRWSISDDSYACEGHSRTGVLPDEVRANADPAVQAEIRTTQLATDKVLLRQEVLFRDIIEDTVSNFTVGNGNYVDSSGTARWFIEGTSETADPVQEIQNAKTLVTLNTGVRPNVGLCNREVADKMKHGNALKDRFKYTFGGSTSQAPGPLFTDEALRSILELDRMVIADSLLNSAAFGAAPSLAFLLGDNFWLFFVPPSPGLQTVSFGYTFLWTAVAGGQRGIVVERERATGGRRSDLFHVHKYYDLKVVDVQAAYMFEDVLTA